MNNTENLRKWRKDRNITEPNTKAYIENILEELLEIVYEDKKDIKINQEAIMDICFNKRLDSNISSKDNLIDAIQDIRVFSENETELMGYDADKTLNEVIKEVSSRKQDPDQFIEWQQTKPFGKWKKWSEQPKETLYKADFSICKLNDKETRISNMLDDLPDYFKCNELN